MIRYGATVWILIALHWGVAALVCYAFWMGGAS